MKIALIQLNSRENKEENITKALQYIDEAALKGAEFILLPEYIDYMGDVSKKLSIAETIPGPTSIRFSEKAKEHGIYINIGSMHEFIDGKQAYNTSVLFDDMGDMIGKYRKVHLYNAEFEDRISSKESDHIKAGDELVTAETKFGTVGLTICYDLRFPELYRSLALQGSKIIFAPAAFPSYTGSLYWETLLKARAVENQCFVVATGQIGKSSEDTTCYGNSLIVDPYGTVVAKAAEGEGVTIHEINLASVDEMRHNMPTFSHRRPDVYKL